MIEYKNTAEQISQQYNTVEQAEQLVLRTKQSELADKTIQEVGDDKVDLARGSLRENLDHYKITESIEDDEGAALKQQLKRKEQKVDEEALRELLKQQKMTDKQLNPLVNHLDALTGRGVIETDEQDSGDNVLDYQSTGDVKSTLQQSFTVSGNAASVNEIYQEAS